METDDPAQLDHVMAHLAAGDLAFAVTLATGVTVLFVGFLVATSGSSAPGPSGAPGAPGAAYRNTRRSSLPAAPFGRASTTRTDVGHL